MFRDDEGAVSLHLDDWITDVGEIGNVARQSYTQLPPDACAPHSIMCPAMMPAASLSQSSARQPNSCTSGAIVSAVSVERPVTTTLAPRRQRLDNAAKNRCTRWPTGRDRARWPSGSPVSMLRACAPPAVSSSSRGRRSSPSNNADCDCRAAQASRQRHGVSHTRPDSRRLRWRSPCTPRFVTRRKTAPWRRKVTRVSHWRSRSFCFCKIDIVTSAR